MSLQWKSIESPTDNTVVHSAVCAAVNGDDLKLAMEQCLDQALAHLDENVTEDSLYFLCEWQFQQKTLTVSVTNEHKNNDSKHKVNCVFDALSESELANDEQEFSENVRFWLKDYMSLSDAFLQFSIIALYTDAGRTQTRLL